MFGDWGVTSVKVAIICSGGFSGMGHGMVLLGQFGESQHVL